jgi:hypothetical protein
VNSEQQVQAHSLGLGSQPHRIPDPISLNRGLSSHPSSFFFVSIASKRLSVFVSPLESTFADGLQALILNSLEQHQNWTKFHGVVSFS